MVLLVNDTWHLSKLLQENRSPSLDVSLKDGSERFEALARTTEGSTMGLDDDMAQSMTLVRFQQYMLELVATALANRGFIVSGMNRQNKAWEHNGLQARLKNPKTNFSVFDLHSCCSLRARECTALHLVTNHSVHPGFNREQHASCPSPSDKQRTQVLRALSQRGNS